MGKQIYLGGRTRDKSGAPVLVRFFASGVFDSHFTSPIREGYGVRHLLPQSSKTLLAVLYGGPALQEVDLSGKPAPDEEQDTRYFPDRGEFLLKAGSSAVEIFSTITDSYGSYEESPYTRHTSPLCQDPGLGDLVAAEATKSVALPEEASKKMGECLSKKGGLFAVGPGWIEPIDVKSFFVKPEPNFCGKPNFAVIGHSDPTKNPPFFYTTHATATGSIEYKEPAKIKVANSKKIKFELPRNFKMKNVTYYAYVDNKGQVSLAEVVATGLGGEDLPLSTPVEWHGLFNVGGRVPVLMSHSRVFGHCFSADWKFMGALDYDNDGDLDLLIQAAEDTQHLFVRTRFGFRSRFSWGMKACLC